MHFFFFFFSEYLLHHIQRARVGGSGSIYRRWCTGRMSSSAEWRPRSHTPLSLYFRSSYWCPALPTQTEHGVTRRRGGGRYSATPGAVPTSSVSSRPLSSYSERTRRHGAEAAWLPVCSWLKKTRYLPYLLPRRPRPRRPRPHPRTLRTWRSCSCPEIYSHFEGIHLCDSANVLHGQFYVKVRGLNIDVFWTTKEMKTLKDTRL